MSLNPCCNGRYSMSRDSVRREGEQGWGLNPCCNGRYSMSSDAKFIVEHLNVSLNPCCNGRYSMRESMIDNDETAIKVLILVVMEDTQWVLSLLICQINVQS